MKKPACDLCSDNNGIPEILYMHGRCHMTAPLQASIENGILTLSCYIPECRRVIAKFKVESQIIHETH